MKQFQMILWLFSNLPKSFLSQKRNTKMILAEYLKILPGGGGTLLYGLYRYVPRDRIWFLEVLDIFFANVGTVSRCDP